MSFANEWRIRASEIFGLRLLGRLGPVRFLQLLAIAYLLFAIIQAPLARPFLLRPADVGSDPSNYYAAGQRLNDGHPLYRLSPGDRPVPLQPPYYDVPLLSPPPIAVMWRPLALLPAPAVMTAWWFIVGLVCALASLWLTARGSMIRSLAMLPLGPSVALTIWSGNVTALAVVALIGAWELSARGRPGAAGAMVALAAAWKVSPILLAWWFVVRRDWRGLGGLLLTSLAIGLVSVVGAGLENHLDYLEVARRTSLVGATAGSVPRVLESLGLSANVAELGMLAVTVCGLVASWALRKRPGASFAVALLTGVFSSPVVIHTGLTLLLAATSPFGDPERTHVEASG